MMKTARPYRKITNRSLTSDGLSRVWAADDHFLLVGSLLVYEHYARVYFADIRGIEWKPSKRFAVLNYVLGAIALLSVLFSVLLAGAAFIPMDSGTRDALVPLLIGLAVLAGSTFVVSFLLFVINLLRGATCSCRFLTDRGPMTLRAPTRIRQLRKLLAHLKQVKPIEPPSIPAS